MKKPILLFIILLLILLPSKAYSHESFNIHNVKRKKDIVYSCMEDFIDLHRKKNLNKEYCDDILDSFIFLIDEEGNNIEEVLFFLALCSVESNFDQFCSTKYGVGISQVVYRVHKKYISELGVSKEKFYKVPKWNIYVGYNVFKCYLKSSKNHFHRAATKYNGNATKGYADNVTKRFNFLVANIKEKRLDNNSKI